MCSVVGLISLFLPLPLSPVKRKEPQNPSREVSGSGKYISGCLLEFDKEWYHGEQTREEAEEALKNANGDCFLIQASSSCQSYTMQKLPTPK